MSSNAGNSESAVVAAASNKRSIAAWSRSISGTPSRGADGITNPPGFGARQTDPARALHDRRNRRLVLDLAQNAWLHAAHRNRAQAWRLRARPDFAAHKSRPAYRKGPAGNSAIQTSPPPPRRPQPRSRPMRAVTPRRRRRRVPAWPGPAFRTGCQRRDLQSECEPDDERPERKQKDVIRVGWGGCRRL